MKAGSAYHHDDLRVKLSVICVYLVHQKERYISYVMGLIHPSKMDHAQRQSMYRTLTLTMVILGMQIAPHSLNYNPI